VRDFMPGRSPDLHRDDVRDARDDRARHVGPGSDHRYQFTVNFPDGGAGGADNAYQGASTTVEYDWSSTS
jgi:hypothetical protein